MKYFIITSFLFSYLFAQIDYNSQIQPIFNANCVTCHQYGGSATLNLTTYNGLITGGWSGQSIIFGNHEGSLLYQRIIQEEGTDGSMPPNNPLSQSEIDLIAQWINQGAALQLDKINNISPKDHILHQNYPNPFNPLTSLRYDIPNDGLVNITVYDMMGRIVKTLVNGSQTAGFKSVQWNATNDRNESVSAGLYLYTIQAGEFRQSKKMVLLK